LARIEIDEDGLQRLFDPDLRKQIHARLRQIGFDYVTMDLLGYRTGSMNITLTTIETR
jgi:uncharacterized protein